MSARLEDPARGLRLTNRHTDAAGAEQNAIAGAVATCQYLVALAMVLLIVSSSRVGVRCRVGQGDHCHTGGQRSDGHVHIDDRESFQKGSSLEWKIEGFSVLASNDC